MENTSILTPELLSENNNFQTDYQRTIKLIGLLILESEKNNYDEIFTNNLKKILNSHIKQHIFLINSLKELNEIEQLCGQYLGYPWYKDDQVNFPGATEKDGVCVGDHTSATIVNELIESIKKIKKELFNA